MDQSLVDLLEALKLDPLTALIIAAAAVAIPMLFKGLFELGNAHHARRKDSIEAWVKPEIEAHDLALEMLVRNCYDVWLPAATIRRIRKIPFASRVFIDLSKVMDHLEPADDDGRLRLKTHADTPGKRHFSGAFYGAGYFVSALIFALMLGVLTPSIAVALTMTARIVVGLTFIVLAVFLLNRGGSILEAGRFAERHANLFAPSRKFSAKEQAKPQDEK